MRRVGIFFSIYISLLCAHQDFKKVPHISVSISNHTTPHNFFISCLSMVTAFIYKTYKSPQALEPSHKWTLHEWDRFLHQKFPGLDTDSFAQKVITFYEGYHYKGFREFISYLDCAEHCFDQIYALTDLIGENFGHIHAYLTTLPEDKRDVYRYVVQDALQQRTAIQQARNHAPLDLPCEFQQFPLGIMRQRTKDLEKLQDTHIHHAYYILSSLTQRMLKDAHLNVDWYKNFQGKEIQHAAHKELINFLDELAMHDQEKIGTAIDFAEYSRQANVQGDITRTYYALNVCWSLLISLGKGCTQGIYATGQTVVQTIINPMQIVHDIKCTCWHIKRFIGSHIKLVQMPIPDGDDLYGTAMVLDVDIGKLAVSMQQYIKEHPYQAVVQATSHITQAILTPLAFKATFKWIKQASGALANIITKAEHATEKTKSHHKKLQAHSIAGEIAQEAMALTTFETIVAEINTFMQTLEPEIAELRILFDDKYQWFAKTTKFIKIPYKHIFGIEYEISKKGIFQWSGLHHDFMGQLEKKGLIKLINTMVDKNGVYKADVIVNGKLSQKTFFPKNWPKEKVVSKIVEAYENFRKDTTLKKISGGKYIFHGLTNEGIKIEMFITENGKITSAYPLI